MAKTLKIRIDDRIRISKKDVDPEIIKLLQEALTFENEEKLRAKKSFAYNWEEMPDNIYLWREIGDTLMLPRGFASQVESGLKKYGFKVEWDVQAVLHSTDFSTLNKIKLRPHQEPAVRAIMKHKQGAYQAPAGSGKTVAVLEAIRRICQKSLVIVGQVHIAEQWRKHSREFLGYDPGLIGDGVFEEKDITIALQQTLWSQRHELSELEWWDNWGFVCLDELHHIRAVTFEDIIQRFPAFYRIGTSATPKKSQTIVPYSSIVLGDIFHITTKEELRGANVLVEPSVKVVKTDFKFKYRPDIQVGQYEECPLNCGKTYQHVHRNNYSKLQSAIAKDQLRNELIAGKIFENKDHCNLIITRRLNHIEALLSILRAWGWAEDDIYRLRGKESREERIQVANEARAGVAIFSTVADEALDIPRIDRIHLTWPTRNPDLVLQQIGRGERVSSNGKVDAIVYDYADLNVGVLKSQFKTRKFQVYLKEGYKINE